MAGLDPAIHAAPFAHHMTWMRGSSLRMTVSGIFTGMNHV
jgi:hypothetical protein